MQHPDQAHERVARRPFGVPSGVLPWVFAAFVIALLVLGVTQHRQSRNASEQAALEALHSTSRLTAHGLNLWIAERYADAEAVALSPLLAEALVRWRSGGAGEGQKAQTIQAHIDRIRTLYNYRAVALIDAHRATVLFASGRQVAADQAQRIADVHVPDRSQWLELPVPDESVLNSGIVRGIPGDGRHAPVALYLEIDPERLVESLQKAQPLNWSGESLLLRRYMNGLRYLSVAGGPVMQILPTTYASRGRAAQPVAEALLATGALEQVAAPNREGVPVVAMRESVNMPAWVLVSLLGEDAVYAPLYSRSRILAATLAALLVLGGLALMAWRRSEVDRLALREAGVRRYYEDILRNAADMFILADSTGRIVEVSESALKVYGYTRAQMLRLSVQHLSPPGIPLATHVVQGMQPGETRPFQVERQRADGSRFMHAGSIGLIEVAGERYYHTIGRDVTQQRKIETRLRIAASFFERSAAAIVISDAQKRILVVNPAFISLTGHEAPEVLGKPTSFLNAEPDSDATIRARHILSEQDHWEGELLGRRKNGEVFPARMLISAYRNSKGEVEQYVDIFSDLTRLKQAESQAEYLAHNDRLTGLPNRAQLERQLPALLEQATTQGARAASVSVALLNVDRLKNINDSLGHAHGDALLVAVAQRLRPLFPDAQHLFRYGGDEFILVMIGNPVTHALLLSMVRSALALPLMLGEYSVSPTASIGVASFPEHAASADALLRNVEAAMRMAKAQGRNTWRLYEPEMNATAYDDMLLAVELRQAIDRHELQLYLQPQFRIADGALVGMEALLRWKHAVRGMVSPARFIPIAESSGMIVELSNWVLREACRIWAGWRRSGLRPPPMAVNLSPLQFQHAEFLQDVARAMAEFEMPPHALEMELTEGLIMADTEAAISTMRKLVEMGIQLAIDDFGTGYSSLSYLRQFPVKKLKIDRSFVMDLGKAGNREGAVIATAVIGMAKNLNLKVIAEGVENEAQRDFLRAQGCDEVQGYLYARPLAHEDMTSMLRENADVDTAPSALH